eukprot:gene23540-9066_t
MRGGVMGRSSRRHRRGASVCLSAYACLICAFFLVSGIKDTWVLSGASIEEVRKWAIKSSEICIDGRAGIVIDEVPGLVLTLQRSLGQHLASDLELERARHVPVEVLEHVLAVVCSLVD